MKAGSKPATITYEMAQEEVAASSGFDMSTEGKTKEYIVLREDLLTIMPMLHETNAMSEELNKKVLTLHHVWLASLSLSLNCRWCLRSCWYPLRPEA